MELPRSDPETRQHGLATVAVVEDNLAEEPWNAQRSTE